MAFLVRPFHKHTVSVDGIECSPIISRATKRTRPRRVPRFGRMKNDDELNESYSECTTPLTALEKLGWPSTITLCVAPLTSLLALIFLILLWTPTFRNSWPVITTTSWLSRSVTLSALVIRTGADFLTAVCVSMLASLILESGACQLNDLAGISVMRAEAPSPWILLLKLKVSGNLSYTFLVLLLSTLGIGLQFSSTILLADFTPGKVPGISYMTDYTYDLNWGYDTTAPLAQIGNQDIYNTTRYTYGTYSGVFQSAWTQRPKNIPVFGEYRQMVPRQSGVDDSGYVFTSFIPFDQAEQRTRVAKFQGPSFVLDSRVSCQRPNFLDIKATPALYNGVPKNPLWYTFIGHVTNSTNVEGLWFPTNASRIIPFGCQYKEITSILLQRNDTGAFEGGLGFHICQIQGVDTMIQFPHKNKDWAILQPTESAGSLRSGLYPYAVGDSFPARGPAFLVIASNFTLNQSHSTHEAFTKVTFEFDPGSNIIAGLQISIY